KRYMGIFSPSSYILALDELLDEAGVDVWYDTLFCKSCVKEGRIEAVEVENKSGRLRIEGGCFVDATGDGDAAISAGAAYVNGSNTPAIWEIHYAQGAPKTPRSLSLNQERFCGNWKEQEYPGIDGWTVTDFVRNTRRRLRHFYQEKYAENPQLKHEFFSMLLPSMATFRRTRAVTGLATMCDANEEAVFEDSVALINEWRTCGPVREVPYGALLPRGVKGILTAGRCISSIEQSWEWTRVIPAAAVTGQIAGFASYLAVRDNVSPDEIDVKELQQKLLAEKFYLHRPDFCYEVQKQLAEIDAGHIR
ncbi:MAG: FAD-dependent oxidoreductase, partial [Lentisphaeria bacterium]|nr:FAD-dependent oxidoreductase [Lentisphaeria bacterium]